MRMPAWMKHLKVFWARFGQIIYHLYKLEFPSFLIQLEILKYLEFHSWNLNFWCFITRRGIKLNFLIFYGWTEILRATKFQYRENANYSLSAQTWQPKSVFFSFGCQGVGFHGIWIESSISRQKFLSDAKNRLRLSLMVRLESLSVNWGIQCECIHRWSLCWRCLATFWRLTSPMNQISFLNALN
jgi:hypothetical protein